MRRFRWPAFAMCLCTGPVLRLGAEPAGSPDGTFIPNIAGSAVYAAIVQPDGKILIGGVFTSVGGQPRNNLARLHPDGSLESVATFNPGSGVNGRVNSIALQADGKI